ncbi:heavy-metal-associated domain-containing protein [Pedobacter africanus]|jgi:copper chaperone CopZ|uniref:Copper chaperone CopZ n=2 Tax=Pedobacter africanus TaxID=151894 RepID=A0ACC6L0J0_9SPHI|nr:heavy metal-associated domain-containing protein [Pedobacter africanus]MDR6785001.1 copper chaperone CopZ [Pedobacter africanus]SMC46642.1 Copper chaperone CopZ [Pedobacter africanus]
METLKFKTNIKCSGCIAAVTPFLNELPEVTKWEVDTNNPDKILTIEGNDSLDAETVVNTIEKAGYAAREL